VASMGPSTNVDGDRRAYFVENFAIFSAAFRAVTRAHESRPLARERTRRKTAQRVHRYLLRATTETRRALDRSKRGKLQGYAVAKEHVRPQMTTTVRSGAM